MQKKFINKWLTFLLALTIAIIVMPSTTYAQTSTWISCGNNSYLLENTDIVVSISNGTIHISGNGAIPDYDLTSLSQRPWHNSTCNTLIIDDTITSIGEYAFARLAWLEDISFSSTTFINSTNAFSDIAPEPIFHIKGYTENVIYYGTVPYTSLDSIKAFAQSFQCSASFLLDEQYMVSLFQNSTNPTLPNVYLASDSTTPWNDLTENHNGNDSTDVCTYSTATPSSDFVIETQFGNVKPAFYEAFASFIGDYTFATAFSMEVSWKQSSTVVNNTLYDYIYELTIPEEYIQAGRSFRIIAIGSGNVEILDDIDTNDTTISFVTNTPTKTCALVYKDL